MIKPVTMYSCFCDNCGTRWEDHHNGYVAMTDEVSIKDNVQEEEEWYSDNDKDYCPDCWTMNEDDKLIIDESRKQNIN